MSALELIGSELVHLDPDCYMWIDLKRFRIVDDVPDNDLLASLMRTPAYGYDYSSSFDPMHPGKPVHGRWSLDRLAPTMFEPVAAAAAAAAIERWARDPDLDPPQSEATMARLRSEVLARLESGAVHELHPPTEPDALHEYGWVVGDGGFLEYLVIDRTVGTLTLIVASDD